MGLNENFLQAAGGTTCICDFPITATSLYQLESSGTDTCSNYDLTTPGTSPTYGVGKFGNCAIFNGSSQSYAQASKWGEPTTFSLSFWVNFDVTNVNHELVYCYNWNGSSSSGWKIRFLDSTDKIEWQTYYGNTQNTQTSTTVFSASTWYNIAFTATQTTIKFYVNGAIDNTTDITGDGFNYHGTDAGEIGAADGYDYLNGKIDQFRMFPSELTAAQVTELYNETVC